MKEKKKFSPFVYVGPYFSPRVEKTFKTIFVWAMLLLLIFLTLFPRITEVLNQNYLFGFDQGRDYLAVRNIVVNHHPTLIGSEWGAGSAGFTGLFHGPFYYYFLSIPFVLWQGDPYGGIVLMFILSISAVVIGFLLGRTIFGTLGGLFVALFIAMSPPLISQARFFWNSHPATPFILIAFYFVYKIKKMGVPAVFLAAFFSGFIYNFQTAIAIPMSISLLILLAFFIRTKKIQDYLAFFFGSLLAFTPLLFFEMRHNLSGLFGLLGYVGGDKKTAVTLRFMEYITRDHFNTFLFNFHNTFPRLDVVPPIVFALILFSVAFYFLLREENANRTIFFWYLFLLPVVSFGVFLLLKNAVYPYYLIELNILFILLFVYALFSSLRKQVFPVAGIFMLVFLFFLVVAIPSAVRTFVYDYSDYGGDAKIKGKTAALDYIYKDAAGKNFGLFVFSPPIYTYPYDYLIQWYGKRVYGYVPSQQKKGLFYLLVEKDHEKPWTYKGWMETVIKTGKVMETKTLSNGFIVQKRIGYE